MPSVGGKKGSVYGIFHNDFVGSMIVYIDFILGQQISCASRRLMYFALQSNEHGMDFMLTLCTRLIKPHFRVRDPKPQHPQELRVQLLPDYFLYILPHEQRLPLSWQRMHKCLHNLFIVDNM